MWALVESGTVKRVFIHFPTKLTVSNKNYDKKHLQSMSESDRRTQVGIYEVTLADKLDERFYTSKNPTYAVSGNKVVETIEKAADRKLADEDAVDSEGNKLKDDDGNQVINYGLKTQAKNKATTTANNLLQGFNWLIQRKVTADTAIPSDVLTYMAAIRTDHKAICDAIDGASDMNAFIALHNNTYKTVDGKQVVDVVARVERWTSDSSVRQYRR